MTDVTSVLSAIEEGDANAAERLLPLVYSGLRELAARKLAQEFSAQTLDATGLVHEAYLRLVDTERVQHWNSRGHFFAAAAEAMRRILVERARHKKRIKAGGEFRRHNLADIEPTSAAPNFDILALNEALDKLAALNHRQAEVVKMRFFAGMTIDETAEALGVSTTTAETDWAFARCWLKLEIDGHDIETTSS